MALTYGQRGALLKDIRFLARVNIACGMAARKVALEAPATTNHTERMRWVKAYLTNPEDLAFRVARVVITDPDVYDGTGTDPLEDTESGDTALQTVVDGLVTVLSVMALA